MPLLAFFFKFCLRRRKFGQNRNKTVLWESSKNQFGRPKKMMIIEEADKIFKIFFENPPPPLEKSAPASYSLYQQLKESSHIEDSPYKYDSSSTQQYNMFKCFRYKSRITQCILLINAFQKNLKRYFLHNISKQFTYDLFGGKFVPPLRIYSIFALAFSSSLVYYP